VFESTINASTTGLHAAQVNLSNMPKGLYAVQVKTAEGVVTRNVIVE
jgi:hypothetical protein